MNNIKTALKHSYHQRWLLRYSEKRICPKIHEDASLAARPCYLLLDEEPSLGRKLLSCMTLFNFSRHDYWSDLGTWQWNGFWKPQDWSSHMPGFPKLIRAQFWPPQQLFGSRGYQWELAPMGAPLDQVHLPSWPSSVAPIHVNFPAMTELLNQQMQSMTIGGWVN